MGPNDPFDTAEIPRATPGRTRFSYSETAPHPGGMPPASLVKRYAPVFGLVLGLVFGMLVLAYNFTGALLVLLSGGLGAFLGWFVLGLATRRFDPGAAWRAFYNQDRARSRQGL